MKPMDTDFYRPRIAGCCVALIDKHSLDLRMDDFGMGTEVYQGDKLLGYWFQSMKCISFYCAVGFDHRAPHREFDTWEKFCEWMDRRLTLIKAMGAMTLDDLSDEISRHHDLGLRAPSCG